MNPLYESVTEYKAMIENVSGVRMFVVNDAEAY